MNSYFFFNPYDIQTKGIDRPYEEQIKILKKEHLKFMTWKIKILLLKFIKCMDIEEL